MNSDTDKLQLLRDMMRQHQLDYYLVPHSDPHMSEYIPPCWQRRTWLSGFDGSAGDILVGLDQAYLWTDGRYLLQAEMQLDLSHYQIMPIQQATKPPIAEWLRAHTVGKKLGVDPTTITIADADHLHHALTHTGGELAAIKENLVDAIWHDRPQLHHEALTLYSENKAGYRAQDQISMIRDKLKLHDADYYLTSTLDEIAWLYNIRGHDMEYNPLVISYALVGKQDAILFLDLAQVNDHDQQTLQQEGITLQPYTDFYKALAKLKGNIVVAPQQCNWDIELHLPNGSIIKQPSWLALPKACKNPTEIKGMYAAHERDAVAVIEFLAWLEKNWRDQTELSAAKKLDHLRSEQTDFRGLSFPTISGYANHGAIIHYRVTEKTDQPLGDQSLYLIDSGGQYLDGTTDITRTIHLGEPTAEQKRHYTLVLKGHLALRNAVFPEGTSGSQLDTLARMPLWREGLDYAHGTGHGVGHYLCVHEGPQRIIKTNHVPLQAGMIVSNEPGFYWQDHYGIRIENLVVTIKKYEQENRTYLGFDDLTLVPYCTKLIDFEMLSQEEIKWLKAYHARIQNQLSQHLSADAQHWLATTI